jgi:hypothetical protein
MPETAVSISGVRVVGQKKRFNRIGENGREVPIDKTIVGLPGIDVKVGDTFDWHDSEYEIINIQDEPDWHVVAEATRRG